MLTTSSAIQSPVAWLLLSNPGFNSRTCGDRDDERWDQPHDGAKAIFRPCTHYMQIFRWYRASKFIPDNDDDDVIPQRNDDDGLDLEPGIGLSEVLQL